MKIGDNILRIFKSETTPKYKSKYGEGYYDGKVTIQISIEQYQIVEITDKIITINESGNKSNGTYGFRRYDRQSGRCLDDNVKPANKSRRSIKFC